MSLANRQKILLRLSFSPSDTCNLLPFLRTFSTVRSYLLKSTLRIWPLDPSGRTNNGLSKFSLYLPILYLYRLFIFSRLPILAEGCKTAEIFRLVTVVVHPRYAGSSYRRKTRFLCMRHRQFVVDVCTDVCWAHTHCPIEMLYVHPRS